MSELTLGEFLRQEREKSGITIEQVASATKISVRVLHAIEGDHFGELPARPFVRGFVSSYSRFVGLEPKEVLIRFDHYIQQRCEEREQGRTKAEAEVFDRQDSERSRTMLWAVMGFFVVAAGIVLVLLKQPLKHKKMSNLEKLKATTSAVVAPAAAPASVPASAPAPVKATNSPKIDEKANKPPVKKEDTEASDVAAVAPEGEEPQRKKDPLNKGDDLLPAEVKERILLKTTENIWIRYRVDDKPPMKFMLLADRLLLVKARTALSLQVSNPDAVKFRYQWGPYQDFSASKFATRYNSTATVVIPKQPPENTQEPFLGELPLPAANSP